MNLIQSPFERKSRNIFTTHSLLDEFLSRDQNKTLEKSFQFNSTIFISYLIRDKWSFLIIHRKPNNPIHILTFRKNQQIQKKLKNVTIDQNLG